MTFFVFTGQQRSRCGTELHGMCVIPGQCKAVQQTAGLCVRWESKSAQQTHKKGFEETMGDECGAVLSSIRLFVCVRDNGTVGWAR